LLLIAQAVFLLEREETDRQTNEQTDATKRPTHAAAMTAWVVKLSYIDKVAHLYPFTTIVN